MEIVGTEEWFDMLHDDIIFHFPNAPFMGGQEILVGKDEVVPYLRTTLAQADHLRFHNVETWDTQAPNIFFNEYHATVRTPGGKHFQHVYINQIMVKDGKINFVREYWDPKRRIADSRDFILFG
jgi:ketosteroid isomerase-like protein